MKMNLYVVAKLLSATSNLLFSAYVAFTLSIIAVLLKGWQSTEFWVMIFLTLILIFLNHYLAFRIKFDAELLEIIAKNSTIEAIDKLTQQFDQVLLQLKLMPESKAGRGWSLRLNGCIRLFKLQIALLFLQYFVLIILIYKLLAE